MTTYNKIELHVSNSHAISRPITISMEYRVSVLYESAVNTTQPMIYLYKYKMKRVPYPALHFSGRRKLKRTEKITLITFTSVCKP